MANAQLYADSAMSAADIAELQADHVAVATGAQWTNLLYSSLEIPVGTLSGERVFTPDDVFAGRVVGDRILVFDFDNYYLGGVIAEHLASKDHSVVYATPAGQASAWTIMTNELPFVYQALREHKVEILTTANLTAFDGSQATLGNLHTGEPCQRKVDGVVIVGFRRANTDLYRQLTDQRAPYASAIAHTNIQLVGDALAPGAIAHAVHSGHNFSRSLLEGDQYNYLRDDPIVSAEPGLIVKSD